MQIPKSIDFFYRNMILIEFYEIKWGFVDFQEGLSRQQQRIAIGRKQERRLPAHESLVEPLRRRRRRNASAGPAECGTAQAKVDVYGRHHVPGTAGERDQRHALGYFIPTTRWSR